MALLEIWLLFLISKQSVCQIPASFFHIFIISQLNLTKAFFYGKWFWIIRFLVSWPSYLPHKFFGKDFSSLSCPGLNGGGETTCWDVPNIWFGIIEEHQKNYYCWHFITVLLLISWHQHNTSQHVLLVLIYCNKRHVKYNVLKCWYLQHSQGVSNCREVHWIRFSKNINNAGKEARYFWCS